MMSSEAGLRIIQAGPGTTLQDAGRHFYLRFGITAAGPMDPLAHATANLAVGNVRGATAIEVTLGGLEVTAEGRPLTIAIAGGDFAISLDGRRLPAGCVLLTLDPGAVLKIRAGQGGAWCYLAIAGRLAVSKVLGSHATHTRTGLGGIDGRALRAGDRLHVEPSAAPAVPLGMVAAPWLDRPPGVIRVVLGPQDDYFAADQIAAFRDGPWRVSTRADRMAFFIDGPTLAHVSGYNIVSDGIAMGAIQVPGNGRPIILGRSPVDRRLSEDRNRDRSRPRAAGADPRRGGVPLRDRLGRTGGRRAARGSHGARNRHRGRAAGANELDLRIPARPQLD